MLTRLLDQDRARIDFTVDGLAMEARQGDTLLTAMLADGLDHVRVSEFGDGPRAGFCWMGACQDCWLSIDGRRMRACSTPVAEGMRVVRP